MKKPEPPQPPSKDTPVPPGKRSGPNRRRNASHGGGPKTLEQRESILADVEDLMLRGILRSNVVMRMVTLKLPNGDLVRAIHDRRTCENYMELIRGRWRDRSNVTNEEHRQRLLAQADADRQRAYAIVAKASNIDGTSALSASATALSVALKASERQAKLLGLDSEKRVVDAGKETLDALRDRIAAQPLGDVGTNPVFELYGALPQDPRQERPDRPDDPEPPPEADSRSQG